MKPALCHIKTIKPNTAVIYTRCYSFGFNGKENDNEVKGTGNQLDFGARIYDSRLGRFLSIDPLSKTYPQNSPYSFADNNPIRLIDIDGLAPGDPIGAGYYSASSLTRQSGFIMRHPVYATKIGLVTSGSLNISTNATRFALNTNLPENTAKEGSHINAFRHVLWQATITNQIGESVAKQVGNAHEGNPFANKGNSSFSSLAEADQTIDMLNNEIGREIGKANPNASMQELAIQTLNTFKENGLYTATAQKDGTFTIDITKLTDEQYKNAMQTIQNTNKNGFTPSQQTKRDEVADQETKLILSTNPKE